MEVTESGLGIEDLRAGKGAIAEVGARVTVSYVGRLADGTVFERSEEPVGFELGDGEMIQAWDEGLVGMRVGGLRRLTVPPHLAYGARGNPPTIKPNALLEFEVELLAIE